MVGFNPYFAIAGGLALLSVAGGGFVYGVRFEHGREASAQLKQLNQALQDKRDAENRIAGLETAAAIREQHRQTTVREIRREIPTITRDPLYSTKCIGDDGVRLLDRAAAAANGASGVDPGAPADAAGQPAPAAANR